jgi:hypothetical protein
MKKNIVQKSIKIFYIYMSVNSLFISNIENHTILALKGSYNHLNHLFLSLIL